MDATHHMELDANALLYTVIVRHQLADRWIPVAYLFINDKSADPVTKWLQSIADMNTAPKIITMTVILLKSRQFVPFEVMIVASNTVYGMCNVHGWTNLLIK